MLRFLLRRVGLVIPTFVAVTFLSFLLIHLVPGDPIEVRAGERGIEPQRLAELRHQYGLDQPLWRQFLRYEGQVASGDLGQSVVTRESVWSEFTTLFPATLELATCAILFAILLGVPLGVVAAVKRGSPFDYGLMGLSVTGASMPIFWWGLMAVLVFSVALGWTPVSGRIADAYDVEPWSGFMLIDCWFSEDAGACGSALSHLIL
ncbi:MAG: ABC transporter permease subunit, partial [Acetobacteraceae bacterium]|nr:ABC transporter permease subunit [Acetobacteraceae bacterium]